MAASRDLGVLTSGAGGDFSKGPTQPMLGSESCTKQLVMI